MKLKIFKSDGSSSQEKEFADLPTFEGKKGLQSLKEVIVAQAANARQGTRSTKTRAEVSGGGRKPWKQKGTGRARAGSIRSPIWVGGGVAFGPRPQDFSQKTNRKVKSLAFRRAFFDRAVSDSIQVIEAFEVSPVKTKVFNEILSKIAPSGSVLIIDQEHSSDVIRAARNINRVILAETQQLSTTDLCLCDHVIITSRGLESLLPRLTNGGNS
ncbi:MAG: 50S ribosomal protein L4 [Opitutaceae bacterium]|nr:50S ribosomal protein L4 [Opitutaceae bacterium]